MLKERVRLRRAGGRSAYSLPRERIGHECVRPTAHATVVHEAPERLDARVVLQEEGGLRQMVVERGGEVQDGMGLSRPDIVPGDAKRPLPSTQRRRHRVAR